MEPCQEGNRALKIPLFLEDAGAAGGHAICVQDMQLGTGLSDEQIIRQHSQPLQWERQAR